ncbi:MAG: hypothetical protein HY926_15945 [Elusimicrobia bacterium]|nr:hypothetical protein [Elusimicrobiota bacterium]
MLWRRSNPLPEALASQGRACVAAAEQSARYFRSPSRTGAYAAHRAGLLARREAAAAEAALSAGRDAWRRDLLSISRRLAAGARELAAGTAEASRFGVADAPGLAGGCAGLRACGRGLEAAMRAFSDGARCEAALVEAKRWALVAQRRLRLARAQSLGSPGAVRDLKVRTVLERLEAAVEAWQRAADCAAEYIGSLAE